MVCSKSAVQLASPLKYFSTCAAGVVAAVAPMSAIKELRLAAAIASLITTSLLMVIVLSFLGWCGTIDLAPAIGLQRANQACRLHGLDQARRTVVADLEAALHAGDGRLARLGDDAYRLVVQGIGFGIGGALALLVIGWKSRNWGARAFQNFVDVGRRRGGLETSDHTMHFLIRYEGAVHAGR